MARTLVLLMTVGSTTGGQLMANSTQGLATLVFLVAFTCLGGALFEEGNVLLILLSLAGLGWSAALFLKAKALAK
jgi:hypothetical protein